MKYFKIFIIMVLIKDPAEILPKYYNSNFRHIYRKIVLLKQKEAKQLNNLFILIIINFL